MRCYEMFLIKILILKIMLLNITPLRGTILYSVPFISNDFTRESFFIQRQPERLGAECLKLKKSVPVIFSLIFELIELEVSGMYKIV